MERREEYRKEWPVHCTTCTTNPGRTTAADDMAVILAKYGGQSAARPGVNDKKHSATRLSVGDTFYWKHFSGILGPATVLDIDIGPDEAVWVLTRYGGIWRWVKEMVMVSEPHLYK
jgi:hypothetical protein